MVEMGLLLQHSDIIQVHGVVVAPCMLGQCQVGTCSLLTLQLFSVAPSLVFQALTCLAYISGRTTSTRHLVHHPCQLFCELMMMQLWASA